MSEASVLMMIALGFHIILWVSYKLLRRLIVYIPVLLFTLGMAIFGYFNIDNPAFQMAKASAANFLFSPLIFIILFRMERFLFLKIFKNEPLLSGYMQRSWDQGEYRRLHFGDVIFTISCLLIPMVVPLFFGNGIE
ncbi:hypothetical protein [Fulvivirga ligni]|uniref:hypothetical protein n=1 Tax=Fulvivirga ligni TaxID=2904246 RepID=UPI001F3D085A|nr:hypothetical protein [Fulvivirga ligni]UII24249.1 hypothetical protein LVD16_13590 [Fulvivirga ligni]